MLYLCGMNFYWMKFNEAVIPLEANHPTWINFCVNAIGMKNRKLIVLSTAKKQRTELIRIQQQKKKHHPSTNITFVCIHAGMLLVRMKWERFGRLRIEYATTFRHHKQTNKSFELTQLAIHSISFYYRYRRSVPRFTRQQWKKSIWNRVDTWHFRQAKRSQW